MGNLEVWEDVMDESLDTQVAPELGDVVTGKAHRIYTDAREFFKRTYFTDTMLQIFERLIETFEGRERHNLFLIYSLFGGGKTHTILAIYHAFNDPDALLDEDVLHGYPPEKREKIVEIAEKIKELGGVRIVPVYGKGEIGRPSKPLDLKAYKVRTVWGYIAHALGKYDVMRTDDENLTAPEIEVIRELFSGQKVLLLIDEIVHHVDNLAKSANEDDRRYAGNVAKFLDALGTALLGTKSAVVMTLPMEKEGKAEEEYDRNVVLSLWKAVRRVGGSELYSPLRTEGVAGGELVEVLKKRIFKRIDEREKERIIAVYREVYSNTEVFGRGSAEALMKTYPFHPEYIATLRTIVERGNLQKTRDMVRITRVVVRKLLKEFEERKFAPSLIMPFHINPKDRKIHGILFSGNKLFADYGSAVLDSDFEDSKFAKFSKPTLAELVLRHIFLVTYPYDSPIPLPGFPTKESIARAVYEKNLFGAEGWTPADILNIVEEIDNAVVFIYLNKKGGVYWFWRVANVAQIVESKKEELLSYNYREVYNELKKYIHRMVVEGKMLTKKKKIEDQVDFFDAIIVDTTPQEFEDTEDYKLQVLVRDDIDKDTLWDIIYKHGTGTRTYKNTVVVCYLRSIQGGRSPLKSLLETTATIIACDKVTGDIRAKYGQWGDDVVEIQTSMVKDIRERNLKDLEEGIVKEFKYVAYPYNDDVMEVTASSSSKSVVRRVYDALVSNGKAVTELTFEGLKEYFSEYAEIDIENSMGIPFSEIRRIIRSNTRLPMIRDSLLKEAIKEGVRDLEIGIERGKEILFKRVYNEIPNVKEEGVYIETVRPSDVILPRRVALNRQIANLLKMEKRNVVEGDKLINLWFEVYLTPSSEPLLLRELVEEVDGELRVKDEYFDTVLHGHIVRRYEEKPIKEENEFVINVDRKRIEGKPEEVVEVSVSIEPLRNEGFEVTLEINYGELESYEGIVPFTTKWILQIPKEKRVATLTAHADGVVKTESITLIPRTDIITVSELDSRHENHQLLEILGIESSDDLESIPESINGFVEGSFSINNAFKAKLNDLAMDVAKYIIKEVGDILGKKAILDINFHVEGEVILDDWLIESLRPLNGKVTFKLKKRD
ncbi:DUF499 domain-containing protein [Thermococcus sp. LS2]|nr:DUF499 domain-containing protein [Thermococcus sp. LS2]